MPSESDTLLAATGHLARNWFGRASSGDSNKSDKVTTRPKSKNCRGGTRTRNLQVMSLTRCLFLYPAIMPGWWSSQDPFIRAAWAMNSLSQKSPPKSKPVESDNPVTCHSLLKAPGSNPWPSTYRLSQFASPELADLCVIGDTVTARGTFKFPAVHTRLFKWLSASISNRNSKGTHVSGMLPFRYSHLCRLTPGNLSKIKMLALFASSVIFFAATAPAAAAPYCQSDL